MVFIGFTEFVKIRWSKAGIEALFLHGNWERGLRRRQAFEKVPLPTLVAFDNYPQIVHLCQEMRLNCASQRF